LKKLVPVELCVLITVAFAASASAATLTVNAGGNLQAAIDAAHPGDTIVLQAGATFDGPFKLRFSWRVEAPEQRVGAVENLLKRLAPRDVESVAA